MGLTTDQKERAKGVRFGTLNKICYYLQCEVGDILRFDGKLEEEGTGEESLLPDP